MNTSYSPNGGFTILFDVPHRNASDEETLTDPYSYHSSSSSCSSPVDCTLSLGTASTRRHKSPERNGGGIYWDLLSAKQTPAVTNRSNGSGNGQPDPLLARRCANCDTTSTPLWRNGPRGPKSLCNACGIRYKKEERRAAATAAQPVEPQPRHPISYGYGHEHTWAYAAPPASNPNLRRSQSISLSSDDNDDTAMPYLSWCLNVPHHRPEFLHH